MKAATAVRPITRRLGGDRFTRSSLNKLFPGHWSFLLGEVALYSFTVLVATGIYLTFFFHPSDAKVVYDGSYGPLVGQQVTEAYQSTVHLSLDVRAGLLIRQTHHWAALVFIGSILLHMARVFFTGAFRKPREINWTIGLTLLLLALAMGFTGYSLPGDLLSGTGLRIAYSIAESIPLVGPWLAFLVFGGEWPVDGFTSRLYGVHIVVLPLVILGLLSLHLMILWRQKHTQMSGPGAREGNLIGERLWPSYALKAGGLALLVAGGLLVLGGTVQINPVWLYGPYDPASVSAAAQPDWYIGFLEGSLRLWPGWETRIGGFTIPAPFYPGVVLPGIMFGLLYAVPWLHRRVTGDRAVHHLAQRPRQAPLRTGIGVGAIAFYLVLLAAGGQDVLAVHFGVSVDVLRNVLRALLVVAPVSRGSSPPGSAAPWPRATATPSGRRSGRRSPAPPPAVRRRSRRDAGTAHAAGHRGGSTVSRRRLLLHLSLTAGLVVVSTGCAEQLGMPDANTEQGHTVGRVFDLYLAAAWVVGAFVLGLIAFVVIRYRAGRRTGPVSQRHHNTPLEITYTVVPLLIVAALTVVTLLTIHEVASDEPGPDVTIDVEGYQWGWRFTYVDEGVVVDSADSSDPELVLPSPARVRFEVHSDDVIHSLWVPAFRFKRDLIPGAPTSFTVDIDQIGVYPGKCAEYCGLLHSQMTFTARTVAPDDFQRWLDEQRSAVP